MRKLVFSMNISLDGYLEGPHGELDWTVADAEMHDFFTNLLKQADLMIFGRVAYQLLASYWPTAASDPHIDRSELDFANTINPLPKIVYSRTLENVGWNTQVKREFQPEEIMELKAQPGRNIALSGGAAIAQTFLRHGLVDEIQLVIHPAAIGNGKALFGGLNDTLKLDFAWKQEFASGAVVLCYHLDGKLNS